MFLLRCWRLCRCWQVQDCWMQQASGLSAAVLVLG
jgi:hypothetical protein